ncbi:MAG: MarC family protein [Burkholderiales bacterium]|nr:MarC family protein [Burkholderiales bacterium]
MEIMVPYLKALILVPLTLLPIINPLAGAPVFMATAGTDDRIVKRLARQVALNCWIVLVASMLVGTYVLELFGISLPIVRIGGGLLVAATGWRLLNSKDDDSMRAVLAQSPGAETEAEIVRGSFFPVTFPLTTGPGSIATAIALGAQWPSTPTLYVAAASVASAGAFITALIIYLVYRNAARLLARLGEVGTMVMTRLLAFILLCIGIEIMWTGWVELNQLPLR